ncbi:hypothetical protein KKE60_05485 [Patescibacteria group bacterium]|nr:hypothetical protein [Patescibacteria group bacterium]
MKIKHVELDVTELEWEIINILIHGSVRDILLQYIKDYQMENTEDEIIDAWDSIQVKWEATG